MGFVSREMEASWTVKANHGRKEGRKEMFYLTKEGRKCFI